MSGERRWDDEADVVVLGYGGAGATAAITAADLGASVLILEKQAQDQHTPSTALSGGLVMGVNDVDAATKYLDACSGGMIPVEVSGAWAERAQSVGGWLSSLDDGIRLEWLGEVQHPELPGAPGVEVLQPQVRSEQGWTRGAGAALFASLSSAVAQRPQIRIGWEQPAHRLIQDESGRVCGVETDGPGGGRSIKAERGVVLTCGGFEYDEELKANYLKASPMYFYGNPGNTGDGVRMAQAVGASLWHMNQMVGRAIGHFELDDGRELNCVVLLNPPGYVLTDKFGQRFANEQVQAEMKHVLYYHLIVFDPDRLDYPRIPCYWFFDERRRAAGPIARGGMLATGLYEWSDDNTAEIDRGWISKGETIESAAAAAGVHDPKAAARSVEEYNEACSQGEDPFGRASETLVPLDEPPYYCMKLWPGGPNTCGGPQRNERGQIVNSFGEVIPGLYGAGELGQPVGRLYPSRGADLSEAMCFGRIVAETIMSAA